MKLTIVGGFFLPVPPLRGGATEKIWYRLAQEFAARGHSVTFISRRWPGLPRSDIEAGVAHIRLRGADHSRRLAANLWQDLRWGLRAGRAVPSGDAVLCNTVTLPAWLPRVRPDTGATAVVLGRVPKGQLRWYGAVRRLYATSAAVAGQAEREYPPAAGRLRVIWNPIDWRLHFEARRQRESPVSIGFVGRIHPEKGIQVLLAAAAVLARRSDLPAWRLQLVGPADIPSGGGGEAWLAPLRAAAPPQVDLSAPVFEPGRLAEVYGGFHIFCYPSLAEKGETFGVAVAEAMAAGAVPVVSSLACFQEFIRPGIDGEVFDHRAPDAAARLASVLARLIRDQGYRQQLAAAAPEAVRRFDYPQVAQNILDDLETLVRVPLE